MRVLSGGGKGKGLWWGMWSVGRKDGRHEWEGKGPGGWWARPGGLVAGVGTLTLVGAGTGGGGGVVAEWRGSVLQAPSPLYQAYYGWSWRLEQMSSVPWSHPSWGPTRALLGHFLPRRRHPGVARYSPVQLDYIINL